MPKHEASVASVRATVCFHLCLSKIHIVFDGRNLGEGGWGGGSTERRGIDSHMQRLNVSELQQRSETGAVANSHQGS